MVRSLTPERLALGNGLGLGDPDASLPIEKLNALDDD
jgi:hypothetical protein